MTRLKNLKENMVNQMNELETELARDNALFVTMATDVMDVYRQEECDAKSALEMINSILFRLFGQRQSKLARELTRDWLQSHNAEINFWTGDLD